MSRDLNKAMFIGRLGKDPEGKFTPNGTPITTFSLAVNRSWTTADGTAHEEVEWVRVVAWNKLADICREYLVKGTRCYVEGRLQTRSWQDKEGGEKKYLTEVVADDMIILSPKGERPAELSEDADAPAIQQQAARETGERRDAIRQAGRNERPAPAPQQQAAARPAAVQAPTRRAPVTDDDSDLPF